MEKITIFVAQRRGAWGNYAGRHHFGFAKVRLCAWVDGKTSGKGKNSKFSSVQALHAKQKENIELTVLPCERSVRSTFFSQSKICRGMLCERLKAL